MTTRQAPARLALATAVVVALAVAACSSSGASPAPSAAASAAASAASGTMTVTGAWLRPSAMMAGADAAYFVITNGTGQDDALVSVASPISATVELHETVEIQPSDAPAGSGMGGGMTSASPSAGMGGGGMMAMQPVDQVAIPAGGTVEFKPGGYHVMIIAPKGQPTVGSTVELTLTFEKAPPVTVMAEVRGE
jgi:periplasmic copper chaperone A